MSNSRGTVLVVEDDPSMARVMRRVLELNSYKVVQAHDGVSALRLFAESAPGLILLDLGLPGIDGLEVCRRIRNESEVPIIIVTARGSDADVVSGLEAGADDYVTKPFSAGVLAARAAAALRRSRSSEELSGRYEYSGLVVDLGNYQVSIDGQINRLTVTECKIMELFIQNAGRILSTGEVLTSVWGEEYTEEVHILRTNIARLRRKVEPNPVSPVHIRTVPGVGYQFGSIAADR